MAMTRTRIAVVDDDASVRNALCRLLRASDLDAQCYSNAADFLAALRTFQPHCAIVDLHMPDLNGLETQKQLLLRDAKVPVIIVTGHDAPLSKSECLTAGVWAY